MKLKLAIPRGIVYHNIGFDLKSIFNVLTTNLTNKKKVETFESLFAQSNQSKYCVAFPFARTAIYFALKSQNLPAGSEIIMPPITIKAILDVVLALDLKPVFVDIDPETLCFGEQALRAAISTNTKAVLTTYLFGMVPDLENLILICKEKNLFVIEDFSQCLNGKYNGKKVGNFGDVGIYSSSSIKTLDTYGGGILVTNNQEIFSQMKKDQATLTTPSRVRLLKNVITDLVRNVATSRLVFHVAVFPLLKHLNKVKSGSMIKHTGDRDQTMISSMPAEWFESYSSFQAQVGIDQLPLVVNTDNIRIKNVNRLKENCPNIKFPAGTAKSQNVYWQLVAYFKDRENIFNELTSKNVDTSTTSLVLISNMEKYPYQGKTPNAVRLYNNGFFIPAYPKLKSPEVSYIANVLSELKADHI